MIPKTMKSVINNLEEILHVNTILTPEMISTIKKSSNINIDSINKLANTSDELARKEDLLKTVSSGITPIENVLKIQNQVQNVSDSRQNIGLVAGSIDTIKDVESMNEEISIVSKMKNDISVVIDLRETLSEVLDMKGEIEATNFIAESMRDNIGRIEAIESNVISISSLIEKKIKKIEASEKSIDLKLSEMRAIEKRMTEFSVKTFSIGYDKKAYSRYENDDNILNIFIPEGKPGEKGDTGEGRRGQRGIPGIATNQGKIGDAGRDGKNGDNFKVDIFGNKREMTRFGNRAVGTSFLSLDETPCMIYFRKSNTLDDWTDGQPFGLSDGGLSLDEITDEVIKKVTERRGNK